MILALLLTQGIGRVGVNAILHVAKGLNMPLQSLCSPLTEILHQALGKALPEQISLFARRKETLLPYVSHVLKEITEKGIQTITIDQENYPATLRDQLGEYAPPILFVRGDPALIHYPALAVVGTRTPSETGSYVAMCCAGAIRRHQALSSDNALVVSGGAKGIDTVAHKAALSHHGRTLLIAPQGILTFQTNPVLYNALEKGNLAILSEFPPEAPWETHAAVTRNATISALARVVCVIEPWKLGGSIRTARIALRQGKPVLVRYAPNKEDVYRILQQAGAHHMADTEESAISTQIAACWKRINPVQHVQPELF